MSQPQTLFLIPAEGRVVRDPVRRNPLPPEGQRVPDTSYWRRRLAEGAVLEGVDPEAPVSAPAPEEAPAKKKPRARSEK